MLKVHTISSIYTSEDMSHETIRWLSIFSAMAMEEDSRRTTIWMTGSSRKPMEMTCIIPNTTGHNENVPEVERFFRTVKERVSVTVYTLTFEKYTHRLGDSI